ncbi:Uma2 family endonuclease [Anabaena aphanizomenioides LEGE 00250]|uniref:Uma2 family endonuclease n=1 Tax=Sphaerospermopsis aphanizomenoides LEGE 00250 TaxID=2777972 RepID=A0ABR9VA08_9CYAN|nr:Uma2 family endonuclease [Sphaerospermopsis aphanizomenoides]MBE9235338.1 Uma2 family endonuclease [Sphaerospermopsis aphanizomenoides LEGE 00250]
MYQTDPPIPAQETLPTMYDLPSEYVEDSGLPDEFHLLQPRLLTDTFLPPNYPPDQVFVASDLNLYYDTRNPLWYKRPDWFAVVGVSRLFDQRELRLSYVMWQEIIAPLVMVELLSPKTEKEDLGRTLREVNQPPTKWEVYERIVRVPYYIIFDRYTNKLQAFQLVADRYEEIDVSSGKIWMPGIELGLGLWQGSFEGIERLWLRWYDSSGKWIPTPVELLKQEKQKSDKLAAKLRELGINLDDL